MFELEFAVSFGHLYLLCMESLEIGHLSAHISEVHRSIYFIGKENSFLFIYLLFVDCSYNEEIVIIDLSAL